MCGVFVALAPHADQKVLVGLKRLEYRGYDSWGIGVLSKDNQLEVEKHVGKIGEVKKLDVSASSIAIGHTRWATHGGVSEKNAHPHLAQDQSFMVAHNGVVHNFTDLKKQLEIHGYPFVSETDTEVIVRLIEAALLQTPDMVSAIRQVFKQLEGRNTFIVLNQKGEVYGVRSGSPLIVGFDQNQKEVFFSSDTLSLASLATSIVVIENGQMVAATPETVTVLDIQSGQPVKWEMEPLMEISNTIDKNGYEHFMVKEIFETPQAITKVIASDQQRLQAVARLIRSAGNVYTIGSGTAGIAASQIAFYLRRYGRVKATSLVGAEAMEYYHLLKAGDVMIAPSQSGETADVLEVLEAARAKGVTLVTYINMPRSSMVRMADYAFLAEAGPEVCVMSTKVYVSQIAWGYLLAKAVEGQLSDGHKQLSDCGGALSLYLENQDNHQQLQLLANNWTNLKDIFLLGSGQHLQTIKEGMVKLIEGSYKHAHAIPAGDLKHYAITLIEPGTQVLVVVSPDEVLGDVLNAAHEVKARGAEVVGLSPENNPVFSTWLKVPDAAETAALTSVVPLQLLAYYLSVRLGHDVDHPRNIAKSVTVK